MFVGTLREFQKEAVTAMVERGQLLVAFEMGLGKTPIAIAACEELLEAGQSDGVAVIVCPASLKYQWLRMLGQFAPSARVLVIDGTPRQRERQYVSVHTRPWDYVILNYEQVVNDWKHVSKIRRGIIVVDEIQAIKSFGAKRTKRMKKFTAPYRFGLTGQPVENRGEDVFSIMEWVDESVLGEFSLFDRTFITRNSYGEVERYKNLPLLHKTLSEAMVRRTREEIKDQMPAVVEETIPVELDAAGAKLYRHIVRDLLAEIAAALHFGDFDVNAFYSGEAGEGEAQGKIMSRLTCLRMLCDHPDLLRHSADHFEASEGEGQGSVYAAELRGLGLLEPAMGAPKMRETVAVIKEILEASPKNKVVVFSFFKEMGRMMADATMTAGEKGTPLAGHVIYNGDMSSKAKDAAKQHFATDPDCRLFFSSDAGGTGLDLPQANYLISYDLPWSTGKMEQRQARIIRLSSEFPEVTLLNMVIAGSIEEWQFDKLGQKKAIAEAIVDGTGHDARGSLTLGLRSLSEFLRTSRL